MVPGIEVLLTDSLHLIQGKRVGLLTNHSGRDRNGTSSIDLLYRAPGVKLVALYGPEHGIRGIAKAGEKISSSVDSATGVKVYSLYGDAQTPMADMLKDIDVLLYDIQDVGARVYTYEWTLANTAKIAHKPIIVLDRPDPIRADRVDGNILDMKFASGVGQFPVSLRYGLTPGRTDALPRRHEADRRRYPRGADEELPSLHVDVRRNVGIPWINPSRRT